jgi:hypothetical protein
VIRVLLAEDQAMVRGALVSLLGLEEDSSTPRGAPGRRWPCSTFRVAEERGWL